MIKTALGFRAQRGGAVVVAVAPGPELVLSAFLPTAGEGDRLAFEPYHVAVEMGQGASDEVRAAVAEGRRRQDEMAASGLADILAGLRERGYQPAVAALLVNRAGWMTDLLSYSLAFADHPPVAEGLAVRDALRSAFQANGLAFVETDEKSLGDTAAATFGDVEAQLKALGQIAGKPWRKEQKLACLAAWLAAAAT